jgi:hypothetical protein
MERASEGVKMSMYGVWGASCGLTLKSASRRIISPPRKRGPIPSILARIPIIHHPLALATAATTSVDMATETAPSRFPERARARLKTPPKTK